MDKGNMKNIVVLKDLPSNLVEEAIVVLKENKKVKKYQYIDNEKNKKTKSDKEKSNNYILKEAEMVVSDYISSLETKSTKCKNDIKKLQEKYKKSLQLNMILGFATIISFLISIIS